MVEAHQKHGLNVVSIQIAMGNRRWFIVVYYLAPDAPPSIDHVVGAMGKLSRGDEIVVVGDFNAEISEMEGNIRDEVIAEAIEYAFLEDIYSHFFPRRIPWERDGKT